MKRITLAIIGTFFQLTSLSASAADHNIYAGAGLGQSYYKVGTGLINESSRANGAKLFGGYEFSSYFAVESGYAKLGNASLATQVLTHPANGVPMIEQAKVETDTFYLAAKATAPVNDVFSVFGKLGVSRNRASCSIVTSFSTHETVNGSIVTSTTVANSTCNSTGLLAAFGVDYNLAKNTAIGIEYTSYGKILPFSSLFNSLSSSHASMLSVNIRYSF